MCSQPRHFNLHVAHKNLGFRPCGESTSLTETDESHLGTSDSSDNESELGTSDSSDSESQCGPLELMSVDDVENSNNEL